MHRQTTTFLAIAPKDQLLADAAISYQQGHITETMALYKQAIDLGATLEDIVEVIDDNSEETAEADEEPVTQDDQQQSSSVSPEQRKTLKGLVLAYVQQKHAEDQKKSTPDSSATRTPALDYMQKAQNYFKAENMDLALSSYKQALRLGVKPEIMSTQMLVMAEHFYINHNPANALECYKLALQGGVKAADASLNIMDMARDYAGTREYSTAAQCYRLAIEGGIDPRIILEEISDSRASALKHLHTELTESTNFMRLGFTPADARLLAKAIFDYYASSSPRPPEENDFFRIEKSLSSNREQYQKVVEDKQASLLLQGQTFSHYRQSEKAISFFEQVAWPTKGNAKLYEARHSYYMALRNLGEHTKIMQISEGFIQGGTAQPMDYLFHANSLIKLNGGRIGENGEKIIALCKTAIERTEAILENCKSILGNDGASQAQKFEARAMQKFVSETQAACTNLHALALKETSQTQPSTTPKETRSSSPEATDSKRPASAPLRDTTPKPLPEPTDKDKLPKQLDQLAKDIAHLTQERADSLATSKLTLFGAKQRAEELSSSPAARPVK